MPAVLGIAVQGLATAFASWRTGSPTEIALHRCKGEKGSQF